MVDHGVGAASEAMGRFWCTAAQLDHGSNSFWESHELPVELKCLRIFQNPHRKLGVTVDIR